MASVPKNKILEATRGAILARQSDGLPLLLEELRSPDKGFFGIGLRVARELPGTNVTAALATELNSCPAERKAFLLLAVADRHDATALPAIYNAAASGPSKLRLVAVGILDRQDNVASLPVLLSVAADNDPGLRAAAISALARLSSPETDSELIARLPNSSGRTREAIINVAAQRRIASALPAIISSTDDSDPAVRAAAEQAIGAIGRADEADVLVKLLQKNPDAKERANIETALVALSSRAGAPCVSHVVILEQSDDLAVRIVGLHVLASAGGPDALSAVKTAVGDKDESVQDEAVRTLSTWPNNWPEDSAVAAPLLTLAQTDQKTSHQVLGLRGYLQYVQGDKQLSNDSKVSHVKEALPLIKRPEEQRLAIAILGGAPTGDSLIMLVGFTGQPAVCADACSAVMQLAGGKMTGVSKEQRQEALQAVVAKSENTDTKHKAQELLNKTN